jgi:hypothetical protein
MGLGYAEMSNGQRRGDEDVTDVEEMKDEERTKDVSSQT